MSEETELTIQTTLMPAAELERLLKHQGSSLPDMVVRCDTEPAVRGMDPQVVTAIVTGIASILSALIPSLIARFFSEEPKATVTIVRADGSQVAITGSMSEPDRKSIIAAVLNAGAPRALKIGKAAHN
jgi:hypothetical protein